MSRRLFRQVYFLTGKLGSGKTTAAHELWKRGFRPPLPRVYSDHLFVEVEDIEDLPKMKKELDVEPEEYMVIHLFRGEETGVLERFWTSTHANHVVDNDGTHEELWRKIGAICQQSSKVYNESSEWADEMAREWAEKHPEWATKSSVPPESFLHSTGFVPSKGFVPSEGIRSSDGVLP